jgi:integrase
MKRSRIQRCIWCYEKKDGSKSYQIEIRRINEKPYRETFSTITDAKKKLTLIEGAIIEGRSIPDNKMRKHTLADLIGQYKSQHLQNFPRRMKDQLTHLNWWQATYGEKLLTTVTQSLLSQARNTLSRGTTLRKQARSNSTVNRYFSSLRRAFTFAINEWRWITENPFRGVSKLKENPGRSRFLSREELHSLLNRCKENKNPHLYGLVLIAASMGLRFGEIVNLRWRHIDFENRFVTLEATKNGDVRVVPLPDQVQNYLNQLSSQKNPEDYLFPSRDLAKRHPYSIIRKAFQRALQEAGIQGFRYHDLRHTCASHLAMNGATQGELMEVLGHRSPAMTRRYAHFSKKHIAQLLQKTTNNLIGQKGETA